MNAITIRNLTTYEECQQVRDIQHRCWGFAETNMGLYPPLLLSVSENGGTVLGAFSQASGGEQMVGYLFGYPALHDPHGQRILKIHSQTMGVLPEYRSQGIAEQLKWAQRDHALAMGIELITWTFDPLEGINAHLNLHKLGGIARTYKRNVYGEHFGQLNEGQPTDRFVLEWWIKEKFQIQDSKFQIEDSVTRVEGSGAGQRLISFDLSRTDDVVNVEIPESIQAIRRADLELAREWRIKTREIFEAYFARGYAAVDFISLQEDSHRRNHYILTKYNH